MKASVTSVTFLGKLTSDRCFTTTNVEVYKRKWRIELRFPLATRSAPSAAADRSLNKALNSKAYIGDLLQDIENGSTELESVKSEDLPSELQKLSVEERTKDIEKRLGERSEMRKQILLPSKQRNDRTADLNTVKFEPGPLLISFLRIGISLA